MTTTTAIPPTENEAWGFHGSIAQHADPQQAWPLAMAAIADLTGCSPEEVRAFLDSRHGRHFADEASNGLSQGLPLDDAIVATARTWMGRRIGRTTAQATGIPQGLPTLTGFVMHAAIEAETAC